MKESVAEVAGLERDERSITKAGKHIHRTIDRLNVWDRYSFFRNKSSDTTITEGMKSLDFADDLYIPLALHLVNLDGDIRYTLSRIDYENLGIQGIQEGRAGRPRDYAILNPYDDRTYSFWPYADTPTATAFKLRQVYYERMKRPAADSDVIEAPEEIAALVELGAQFRFARIMRPNHTALWGSLGREFMDRLKEMTQADERENPESWQWTYGPSNNSVSGEPSFLQAFWAD